MGAFWMNVIEYSAVLSEIVGYKAGMILNRKDLHEHLSSLPSYDNSIMQDDDVLLRIRSEASQEAVGHLLYRVGTIDAPPDPSVTIGLYHKYKRDGSSLRLFETLHPMFIDWLSTAMEEAERIGSTSLDPTAFMKAAAQHGTPGLDMAVELLESLNRTIHADPWSRVRPVDWRDEIALRDLFTSESLYTQYGNFLDQRFVNYLTQNFEAIDRLHWRKFEGLVGEYFAKEGYHVEMGPGRNDDGVDLRIWPKEHAPKRPPLILVQCKRQKAAVEKVVVKALWADVLNEKASSGLIVTSSRLAPGAEAVCRARGYEIDSADRDTLRRWITQMRQVGTGVFMGE